MSEQGGPEELLRRVVDVLPTLTSYVDADERYQFVSPSYERWFGRAKAEVVGKRLVEVLGQDAYDAIKLHVERALAGAMVKYEAEIPYRDGGTRWIEATYLPQRGADGAISGFVALIADVTDRKTLELDRQRLLEAERRTRDDATAAAKRLGILSHASRAFAESNLDLDARFQTVALELSSAMDSCINIALLEADGLLHLRAVHHPNPEAQRLLEELAPSAPVRAGEGITGSLVATGRGIILASIDPQMTAARAVPAYRAFLERFPAYALVGSPLKVRGRVIGTVTATRVGAGETYSSDDLALLEELAERAAVSIENARLYQETVGARSRAEQLYRFANAVVGADRIEVVYEAALESIEAALASKRSAVLTFDADGVLRFKAWHGLSDQYRSAVEGHLPWPRDAADPQPVLVADVARDPEMAPYGALFREEGIGALAFIPLVNGGELLGKFMLYYEQPHAFVAHEVEVASAIGNHLASVITRFAVVARLQETIRYNELFAGVLAHDLRNPLGAIITAAHLLMRYAKSNTPGQREERPLSRILSSGQRMSAMIDQLLDFTRARSGGGIEIDPAEADLSEVLRQAVGELELAHPDWNIRREIRGDQRGGWDSDRLIQMISNLIGNAGQHGTPAAQIDVVLDGTSPDRVKLTVHNAGAIPDTLLPHIFAPFRTTHHQRDRSRGLGLGLFIVREIVHAHRGKVAVESTEAGGTTFSVELPRHVELRKEPEPSRSGAAVSGPAPRAAGESTSSMAAPRQTILVVDDDVQDRETLVEVLEGRGFAVNTASNGLEALRLVQKATTPFMVILLDLMMPIMDGYEFLDERRKDTRLASIPVIVVTAGYGIDRIRLGDAPVIPKPIVVPRLMSTLGELRAAEARP